MSDLLVTYLLLVLSLTEKRRPLSCTCFPKIDLDTIDLSNLNRQFLFQKQHVKRPKALVAKETASNFNPHVKINAIHGNIKEQQYDVDWFKGFDLVMNALDNLGVYREHLS